MRTFLLALAVVAAGNALSQTPPTIDPTYGKPIPKPHPSQTPKTHAQWIWTPRVADNQTIYLRRSFNLASEPKSARLTLTADNFFTVSVNGRQVDKSEPDPNDDSVWKRVHHIDVAKYLKAGKNVVAIEGVNVGSAAGVAARLEIGKTVIESDGKWKALDAVPDPAWTSVDFDDSSWPAATTEVAVGDGVWGVLTGWPGLADAGYLAHMFLPVKMVVVRDGSVTGDETFTASGAGTLVLDFGQELTGRVDVIGKTAGTVLVGTGESLEEATTNPWHGKSKLVLAPGQTSSTPWSAFRYAQVDIPAGQGDIGFTVRLDHKYYPVVYKGSFSCSDPLLTKVWYTGAYTSHLCMQEDIWDAPKRDRMKWIGDLHVSGEVIDNVFADKFLMEHTLDGLRADAQGGAPAGEPPRSHVNGIPGYSAAYICRMADFYRHLGDVAYLKRHHDELLGLLEFIKRDFDDRNVFVNKQGEWPFTDWSPGFNKATPLAFATTHMFLTKAVEEAAYLLGEMGDKTNAAAYAKWHGELVDAAQKYLPTGNTFGDRLQENAMAIYSGIATGDQTAAAAEKVFNLDSKAWDHTGNPPYNDGMFSPYYGNYILFAMADAGKMSDALSVVRSYWGGMLAEGATSFWEAYDPYWPKNPFHSNLYADDGHGTYVSLCHGWSSGPTDLLTERVLGVRSTGRGYSSVEIDPDLGGLAWAEGDVPTPHGTLHVRVDLTNGGYLVKVKLPAGVKATVGLTGSAFELDGKQVVGETRGGRCYLSIPTPGVHEVHAKPSPR